MERYSSITVLSKYKTIKTVTEYIVGTIRIHISNNPLHNPHAISIWGFCIYDIFPCSMPLDSFKCFNHTTALTNTMQCVRTYSVEC